MSRSLPKRRAAVSFGVILSLVAMTGLGWTLLGYQPKAKSTTEKPVAKKPAAAAPAKAAKTEPAAAPAGKKPAVPAAAKAAAPMTVKTPVSATSKTAALATAKAAAAISSVDKLHPAKPVFLYIWDGSEAHQKSWEATGLHKSVVGSGLDKSLLKLLDFVGNGASAGPQEKFIIDFTLRGLTKGASISVALGTKMDVPVPQVTIVLPKSADLAKKLDDFFAELKEQANPTVETLSDRKVTRVAIPFLDGYELGWWLEGEDLVLVFGMQAIEAAIDVANGKSANLTTNAVIQKLRQSSDFDVASVSLVDIKALLDLVRELDVPPLPGSEKDPIKVGELLKIAGVDKVGVLTERWGFKDEAIWIESDLEVPAPLTGLMGLYDQKPLTLKDIPTLPAGCEYFMLARHDLSKSYAAAYKIAEEIAEKISPPSAPPVSDAISMVNDALGIDLKADLMEPLGDTIALYGEGNGLIPSAVLLVKLDDAKKVLASLETLEAKAKEQTEAIQQLRGGAPREFDFRNKETLGRKLHIIQILSQAVVSPTWVVDKEWLVIGTTSQAVEAYLKRVDGKLPKWQPPTELVAAQKMLPEKFETFYYFDPRGALKTGLGFAPTGIAMLEEMTNARARRFQQDLGQKEDLPKFPITPEDIPLAEEVTAPLFPSVGTCTVDATGIHWRNRNSIPGLLLPGLPGGVGGVDSVFSNILPYSWALIGVRSEMRLVPPPAVRDQE
jgi:hypothetical protein